MRVLLSTYGSRVAVEPMVGVALQSRALGAEMRVCAPPDEEFAAAQFDTVVAPAEECDGPVATGVMPTGMWR
jgi:vancomycin aglycone glucosyltransferase